MVDLTAIEAQRLHREALARKSQFEKSAAENRAKYPELAKDVDAIRALFPGAKVTYLGKPRRETLEKIKGK